MKFDVIVGNPPYQVAKNVKMTAASGESGFWKKFIKLSFSIVVSGGYVGLVIPSSWPGSKKMMSDMKARGVFVINHEAASSFFPNVPIPIGYFIAQRDVHPQKTELIFTTGSILHDISDLQILPSGQNIKISNELLTLLIKWQSLPKFRCVAGDGTSINILDFKNTADIDFKFPCFYSAFAKSANENRRNIFLRAAGPGQNMKKVVLTHTVDLKLKTKIEHTAPIIFANSVGKQASFICHSNPEALREYMFSFVGVFLDLIYRQKNYTINAIKNFPEIELSNVDSRLITTAYIEEQLLRIGLTQDEINLVHLTCLEYFNTSIESTIK